MFQNLILNQKNQNLEAKKDLFRRKLSKLPSAICQRVDLEKLFEIKKNRLNRTTEPKVIAFQSFPS